MISPVGVATDLHCTGEPFKCLTSVALIVSFHIVKGMKHRNGVNDEDNMMNCVEELVRDTVAEIGRASDNKKSGKDYVAGNHDFISKLITKSLLAIRTQLPEEKEKEDCRKKDD